ncbi:hypothetical protein H4Q26_004582 [Puccinia striiformis f. sp. tritici PST-130]|nr:hypothetical protein H4Q26_004582 [Puccinia striiformis f. sp. tritici PST-130]
MSASGSDAKVVRNFDRTFEEEASATRCLVDIQTIQLNAEDLYDREKVDLEQVELEDVWVLLQTSENGLDAAEVERRRGIFGPTAWKRNLSTRFYNF